MLFKNLHAKIEEEKLKASSIDGRRFNVRSRIKMDREAASLKRKSEKEIRKKKARKRNHGGVFSEEELREGEEAKIQFREEMARKRELKEENASKEETYDRDATSILEEKEIV